ncbi:hypothetical protein IG193_08215 [Infirmifilum lucidum]|uniref:Uncharacterized protein n=1 Tax=Infirmifilum lucidum TaxID=2776706 RepID=A0A7L9FFZ6_9CREN|nr:hypothetical protein [Infirmifilum lucidum]QOJ78720.1 hypothetical protein IG193_08215 [Infirmifilum lucidum]
MRVVLLVLAVLVLVPCTFLAQCPEPLEARAFEAVINTPGARLDASRLAAYAVKEVASGVFAYRSGFDERIAVTLGLEALPATGRQYPVIRLQVLPGASGVTDADLRRALKLELDRLTSVGVIQGLSEELESSLVLSARLGLAGWDRRLVFDNGAWRPFNESSIYVPLRGCPAPLAVDYSSLPVWRTGSQDNLPLIISAGVVAVLALFLAWRFTAKRKS